MFMWPSCRSLPISGLQKTLPDRMTVCSVSVEYAYATSNFITLCNTDRCECVYKITSQADWPFRQCNALVAVHISIRPTVFMVSM